MQHTLYPPTLYVTRRGSPHVPGRGSPHVTGSSSPGLSVMVMVNLWNSNKDMDTYTLSPNLVQISGVGMVPVFRGLNSHCSTESVECCTEPRILWCLHVTRLMVMVTVWWNTSISILPTDETLLQQASARYINTSSKLSTKSHQKHIIQVGYIEQALIQTLKSRRFLPLSQSFRKDLCRRLTNHGCISIHASHSIIKAFQLACSCNFLTSSAVKSLIPLVWGNPFVVVSSRSLFYICDLILGLYIYKHYFNQMSATRGVLIPI